MKANPQRLARRSPGFQVPWLKRILQYAIPRLLSLKPLPPTPFVLHTKCVLFPFPEDSPYHMTGPFLIYWTIKFLQFKHINLKIGKQNLDMIGNIHCLWECALPYQLNQYNAILLFHFSLQINKIPFCIDITQANEHPVYYRQGLKCKNKKITQRM